MNSRDIRERLLRAKLKILAAKLAINEDILIREADSIDLFRDAREAADEFYITINRIPSEKELAEMVATVIKAQLHS